VEWLGTENRKRDAHCALIHDITMTFIWTDRGKLRKNLGHNMWNPDRYSKVIRLGQPVGFTARDLRLATCNNIRWQMERGQNITDNTLCTMQGVSERQTFKGILI
jgi:hypothetical protein